MIKCIVCNCDLSRDTNNYFICRKGKHKYQNDHTGESLFINNISLYFIIKKNKTFVFIKNKNSGFDSEMTLEGRKIHKFHKILSFI